MAVRISRRGLRNWAQNPKRKRSAGRRLGARRRERRRTRSCCLKRIFSASTARVPPVPKRMASLASSFTSNTIAFFMGEQLARHWTRGQRSRIAASGPHNYEFAMYRRGRREPGGQTRPLRLSDRRRVLEQTHVNALKPKPFLRAENAVGCNQRGEVVQ